VRPVFEWQIGSRTLQLGKRTLIMGIVNVTPDSFSDGGDCLDPQNAMAKALHLIDEGAEIIDIGGFSTRPGVIIDDNLSEAEELRRILPVIEGLRNHRPKALISVDTFRANVARAAIKAGADIVNDVSGFLWDKAMPKTVADLKCAAILMHMRGKPDEWRKLPPVGDIVTLVKRELRDRAEAAVIAGIKRERLVLDPGFGFGKNREENYPLLKRFEELHQIRYPLLAGVSRKSFVGRALARNGEDAPVTARLYGTLAAETSLILKGAHIIRTHDAKACADAVKIADIVAS
jgi:dihydropteroate synthase